MCCETLNCGSLNRFILVLSSLRVISNLNTRRLLVIWTQRILFVNLKKLPYNTCHHTLNKQSNKYLLYYSSRFSFDLAVLENLLCSCNQRNKQLRCSSRYGIKVCCCSRVIIYVYCCNVLPRSYQTSCIEQITSEPLMFRSDMFII